MGLIRTRITLQLKLSFITGSLFVHHEVRTTLKAVHEQMLQHYDHLKVIGDLAKRDRGVDS